MILYETYYIILMFLINLYYLYPPLKDFQYIYIYIYINLSIHNASVSISLYE